MPMLWPKWWHCPTTPPVGQKSSWGAAQLLRARKPGPLMDMTLCRWGQAQTWCTLQTGWIQPLGLNGSLLSLWRAYSAWRVAEQVLGLLHFCLFPTQMFSKLRQSSIFDSYHSLCCPRIKSYHCIILHLQTSACWPYNMGAKEQGRGIMMETAPQENNAVNDQQYTEITTAENVFLPLNTVFIRSNVNFTGSQVLSSSWDF